MARCELCGNEYDKSFDVVLAGRKHTFDCFECAIHSLAPTCSHCGCRIIGHGAEAAGGFYCCAHCAKQAGVSGIRDRVPTASP
jgi:Rieske Fe-S protein